MSVSKKVTFPDGSWGRSSPAPPLSDVGKSSFCGDIERIVEKPDRLVRRLRPSNPRELYVSLRQNERLVQAHLTKTLDREVNCALQREMLSSCLLFGKTPDAEGRLNIANDFLMLSLQEWLERNAVAGP